MSKRKVTRPAYPREDDYDEGVMTIKGGSSIVLDRIKEVVKKHPELAGIAGAVSHQIMKSMVGGSDPQQQVDYIEPLQKRREERVKKSAAAYRVSNVMEPRVMRGGSEVHQDMAAAVWKKSGGEDQFHIGDQRKHYLDISLCRR